ncbi:hypothetical protein [Luedemannella flava]|uniref:hypothetical protein n=1 Tax=Luedemannella flava TaxID=349316 RepID=UPI0031D916DF
MGEATGRHQPVIDLGEWGATPVDEPSWADADTPARRRRLLRRLGLMVGLVGLLALGGATTPSTPPKLLWSQPDVRMFDVWGDVVFVHDLDRRRLTAYGLADGVERWHRDGVRDPSIFVVGDHLGMVADQSAGWDNIQWLDAATGRTEATFSGSIIAVEPGGTVVAVRSDEDGTDLARVRLDTGVRTPLLSLPANVLWANDPQGRRLAWWDAEGVLHARDLVTGAELRQRVPVPPVLASFDVLPRGGIGYTGDGWLVTRQGDAGITVMSFRADDLTPRWTRVVPAATQTPGGDQLYAYAWGCGPVVCVSADQGVTTLDAADGHVVRQARMDLMSVDDSVWQMVNLRGPDDVFVTPINIVTGEIPYPAWQRFGQIGRDVGRYLLRLDRGDALTVGVFDQSTGRMTRLGTVPDAETSCVFVAPRLVCLDASADATLRVWRVRGVG